ncbi:MAG: hypothetical protein GXP31_15910 [Kiritimatiellaeota bacterium]|nr:hypothetical protein [Kiritimatiellota bacterium]
MASEKRRSNWHEDVFFGIHYDLHANAKDTELGREVTPGLLRERWELTRPDWVQCDCKGHPGYTSWPTEVGSTSPGVVEDALRIHRDVTRELGIRLGVHYSGVIDSRALELHPEWACIDAKGTADLRSTCRLSPYVDELLIPQMLELIERYDVDGFWVDGENWGSPPCWCDRCKKEFARRTGIADVPTEPGQSHWAEWLAFQREVFTEYVSRYADAVHARKPDCLVCSNWMYTVRQPEPVVAHVDYLSGDYTPNFGAYRAALEARLLDSREMTWDLMVWGFTRNYAASPSPWAMKPALHLCQEVAEVLALGGAVMVYLKPQRTGWLNGWEHEIVAEVADFCRARREVCFKSRPLREAAVLHLASHYYTCNSPLFNYGSAVQSVEGALNALLENHISTDLLTADAARRHLGDYKLVVVPAQAPLPPETVTALEAFAAAGGHVLLSGADLAGAHPDLVGADPAGDPLDVSIYVAVGREAAELAPPWQRVAPRDGVDSLLVRLKGPDPAKDPPVAPVVTCRKVGAGAIVAVHGPLFRDYFHTHFPLVRRLVGDIVAALDIPWEVTLEGPSRLELVARRKDGRLMLNLINRGAGEMLCNQRTVVSELPPVENIVLRVRLASPPESVTLAPAGTALDWRFAAGLAMITVPRVEIHEVVVIEPAD